MSRRFLILCLMLLLVSSIALAADGPEYGGRFVDTEIGDWGEMFNPILYEAASDGDIIGLVFNGLVQYNSNLEIIPELAEKFEISEDGLTYTFYLHKGVKFHDGHELTAEDVAYTYTTLVHPDYTGVRGGDFLSIKGARDFRDGKADSVEGIKVIDDYTIQIITEETDSAFLAALTIGILPAHLLKNVPVAELENNEFNRQPIGTGPFTFHEYVSGQYWIGKAFDDYFLGRPYLDEYMYRIVAQSSLPMLFEKREIDVASLLPDHFKKVKELPTVKPFTSPRFQMLYMGVNQKSPKFVNKRVKQALLYGFNREVMVNAIFKGFGEVAHSVIPTVSWAYNGNMTKYNFNQITARKLLEEAGYNKLDKDGIRMNAEGQRLEIDFLCYQENTAITKVVELYQQMMKLIGVEVNITMMEFNALLDRVYNPDGWDFYIMYWGLTPDPDWSFALKSDAAWNDVFFVNEESDLLLDAGRKELDQEKRTEIYYEWQELVMQELPYYPLMFPTAATCLDVRVHGYNENQGPLGLLVGPEGTLYNKLWIPKAEQFRITQ